MINALPLVAATPQSLTASLVRGAKLDRATTRKLLRTLEKMESEVPGCIIMQAQLKSVLARRDWRVITITADPNTVRQTGVSIGIVVFELPMKPAATPMQKWQAKKGLRR
jgi:hypothetical protein